MRIWWRFRALLIPYRGRVIATFLATLARPLLNAAKIYLLKLIVDNLIVDVTGRIVWVICGGYLIIALGKGIANYFDQYLGGYVGGQVILDLRQQLFARFLRLSLRYHGEHRVGESISRLISDVSAMEDVLISGITDGLAQVLTVIVFAGMLFYLDPPLAAIALIILPFLFGSFIVFANRTRVASRDVRLRLAEITATAEEALANIGLVKTFMRHRHHEAQARERGEAHRRARLHATQQRAIFSPLSDVIATVGTILVVYFGAQALQAGTLTIGGLVIFLAYLGQLYTPLQGLSRLGTSMQGGLAAAERVAAVLDLPDDAFEPAAATLSWRSPSPTVGAAPNRGGDGSASPDAVVFDRVTFGYKPEQPILRGFSLVVPRGQIVALVGSSGGGKSTAVALLQRLYDPDSGQIRFFGHDLREFPTDSLRERLAVVPQEALLVLGTVRDNIAYGRLGVDDGAITHAARRAGFPLDRLDDPVGARGARLSGGQRQRVAIARALVREAPLLIFDEATSALDALSEERVRLTLAALAPRHTVLVVAHRLATVRGAHLIAVVEDGRVVETGSHDALLAANGVYTRMVRAQALQDIATQPTQSLAAVPRTTP